MSSISGILSIARTALLTHQSALEVSGHNIANAETPGYSRQDLLLGTAPSRLSTHGVFGTGVRLVTVGRARDALLDQDVRAQLAPAMDASTRRDALLRVERIFGEPSDSGLASSLDAFWNAWSDLASQPANAGARAVVRQRAQALVERFNSYAGELRTIESQAQAQARQVTDSVNRLSAQIAELNRRIVPAESGGHTANDLRDERDRLLDELGQLVPIGVIDRLDGSNQVMLGGRPLVDGAASSTLELTSGTPFELRFAGETSSVRTIGGRLGALMTVANDDIAAVRNSLDALAVALVQDVNTIHRAGWSPTAGVAGNWDPIFGPTGSNVAFFDTSALGATAGGIALSAAVAADANAIAAGGVLHGTGDNTIALAIAGLRDFSPTAMGNSFGGAFGAMIATLAGAGRAAADEATVSETLLLSATARREATSGVSTDEELMRLMRHQQAYAAAAKVVQTVDEMMAVLIGLKR